MRFKVAISPQFDFCYALAELAAPDSLLPASWWFPRGRKPEWVSFARSAGWSLWLAVPDLPGSAEPAETLTEFIATLDDLPAALFDKRVRRALYHLDAPAQPTPRKREWLHYIGLDPADSHARTLDSDAAAAAARKRGMIATLRNFQPVFEQVWSKMRKELADSGARASDLLDQDLGTIAEKLNLAVEVNRRAKKLLAIRGGYELAIRDIDTAYLMPSAFNLRRFWSAADERLPAHVYFPFLDRAVALPNRTRAPAKGSRRQVSIDPWLACRAIGDPTRGAILRRIAVRPQPAAELIDALNLSKATISHHILQLREAGLIDENRNGRTVTLSIRPATFHRLSDALARDLRLESTTGA